MNGFGFIEYDDPMDAQDVVPGMFFYHTISTFAALIHSLDSFPYGSLPEPRVSRRESETDLSISQMVPRSRRTA